MAPEFLNFMCTLTAFTELVNIGRGSCKRRRRGVGTQFWACWVSGTFEVLLVGV